MQTSQTISPAIQNPAEPVSFEALGLSPISLQALHDAGFTQPSPVQAHLIRPALEGRDCLGNAPTGTGKTAAFLLPVIEKLNERERRPQALVLVPTRELAHQVGREFERLSKGRRTRAAAVVGGESMVRQMRLLASGCQVVIATPGRLMDLMDRGAIDLSGVTTVVLDEADQMLDIGFRPAIDSILEAIPTTGRQTLLLSATMPKAVRDMTRRYLKDPADVRLIPENDDTTVKAIRQAVIMVHHENKPDLLLALLYREQPQRAIVFCRTKFGSDRVGALLHKSGFKAAAMHGDLSQAQRNRVLHAFRSGKLHVLVATDVVGRGIDVPGITHVVNFDVPEDPEHYVHRIGRTGRMGEDGAAVTFVVPDQVKHLDQIEKSIQRQLDSDSVEGIPAPARPLAPRGPRRGRPSFRGNRPEHRRRNSGGPKPGNQFRKRRNNNQRERVG